MEEPELKSGPPPPPPPPLPQGRPPGNAKLCSGSGLTESLAHLYVCVYCCALVLLIGILWMLLVN